MNSKVIASRNRFACIALLLFLGGCATIISGKNQEIQISSTPAQAQVKVERVSGGGLVSAWQGTTPATASLARKYEYLLTVSLEGYHPVEMSLESGSNGWVWGNLLFGGIIGLIIDFSNGAAKKINPGEIQIDLVTVASSSVTGLEKSSYAVFHVKENDGSVKSTAAPLSPIADYIPTY